MGFLDKLMSLFAGKGGGRVESDGRGIYFYVRCAACSE